MDELSKMLVELKASGQAKGHFLGLLHVLIGRRILNSDGTVLSAGTSWRDLSILLKKIRWDPEYVREIAIDPATLPPRDRQRYWYQTISLARVDSPDAIAAGSRFAGVLRELGYDVSSPPK